MDGVLLPKAPVPRVGVKGDAVPGVRPPPELNPRKPARAPPDELDPAPKRLGVDDAPCPNDKPPLLPKP